MKHSMTHLQELAILLLLFIIKDGYPQPNEYREECSVWNNVTRRLDNEKRINAACERNPQCTGFDCNGKYVYSGFLTNNVKFEVSMCFGMYLHPCETPVELSAYIDMTEPNNASFNHVFTGNETLEIPGSHFDVMQGISAVGFLDVVFVPTTKHGKPYALIAMKLKVRLSIGEILQEFPEQMQVTLVPDLFVPVPSCDESVKTPKHQPYSCNPNQTPRPPLPDVTYPPNWNKPKNSTPPPKSGNKPTPTAAHRVSTSGIKQSSTAPGIEKNSTTSSIAKSSASPNIEPSPSERPTSSEVQDQWYDYDDYSDRPAPNKKCVENVHGQCDNHQICMEGLCQCIQGYMYVVDRDVCIPLNPDDTIPILIPDPMPLDQKSGSKKLAIMIGCSIGAVVIVAGILLFVLLRYRSHRARYGNHSPLLNNDDDDDVEPIDVGGEHVT